MRWNFPSTQQIPFYPGYSPFQSALLARRGIGPAEAERFVRSGIEDMHDPLLLKGAAEAAAIIGDAIRGGLPITVYGDYDCDGVTGTALLVESLTKLGAAVDWYINSRFVEGFGMHPLGVEEIARRGTPRLIISVDNGISAVDAVRRARELGMQVVVTDHHEPGEELPLADAIVNPKQPGCAYPDKHLAGVGVAFKVMQLLFHAAGKPREILRSLDLVALGTVADVMPVTGENRVFIKNGLKLINWGDRTRTGLLAIKEAADLKGEVNAHYHLGFIFGPMLNATGRIDGVPTAAVELLLTTDRRRAAGLAAQLRKVNEERQELTRHQTETAFEQAQREGEDGFIVVYDPAFHEGIVGLIASRLKEAYQRPVLVLTDSPETGILKGSVRSVKGFSVKAHLIDDCADLLLKGGGHEMAAGCSLAKENLPALRRRLDAAVRQAPAELFVSTVDIDYVLRPDEIDGALVAQIEGFAPYGAGFPRPTFLLQPFQPEQVRFLGRERNHLRLSGQGVTAIGFNQAEDFRAANPAGPLALLGLPEINDYDGSIQFRMRNQGWRELEDPVGAAG
ncbi:single-stranded-DNA-specific exonuclease RecJ [Heliobacterium gestii]|uniref:Single-stranded-DNA-specific exonuclease RecJ n=1 Tax=Heliomicrobium gestii TaxID=2699 RepID=A0A845LEP1_HELGE|nr:single-stranded-DNA-specific exonuclease RecJ [Heliomicrobium gestii]MBM7867300.1 single-stranded-DNA-specific exonuclease [Heliomicrobium gestii]MZP43854.1 single-stranded-DNA-specific exonuclease RecJ [Heliomicrobium gestii]